MSTTELIKRLKQSFDDYAHTIEGGMGIQKYFISMKPKKRFCHKRLASPSPK